MYTHNYQSNFDGFSVMVVGLAASCDSTLSLGENGAIEHSVDMLTNVQDILVAINNYAIHDSKSKYRVNYSMTGFKSKIGPLINKLSNIVSDSNHREQLRNYMFRIMAHTRDCRKEGMGRGSREPTMFIFTQLVTHFPEWRTQLKDFLHPWSRYYGSIGDLPRLYKFVEIESSSDKIRSLIQSWVIDIMVELAKGMKLQVDNTNKPKDLTAKHLPREGKQYSKLAKKIAFKIFPQLTPFKALKAYRKLVANANRLIDTVEVKMCSKNFSEIEFEKVPGRCLVKNRLAWMNSDKLGITRSNSFDRINASKNYKEFIDSLTSPTSKGAKGNSLFITEICKKLICSHNQSYITLFTAQFNDQVKNLNECAEKNGIDLGDFISNFVMLLDFSASMRGEPINLAYSLAILLSPLMKGPFKDKFLSFESHPNWIDMSSGKSIKEKLNICAQSPWGGSTNFVAAHQAILNILKNSYDNGATKEDVMEMLPRFFLVVSDMQFDAASGNGYGNKSNRWNTIHKTLVDMYHTTGMELFSEPLIMPTMVYWNARTDTSGMPVVSSTTGAIMITGYSSSIVKTFLTAGIDSLSKFSPWSYLKETLENKWYDKAVEGKFDISDGSSDETITVQPPPVSTMDI